MSEGSENAVVLSTVVSVDVRVEIVFDVSVGSYVEAAVAVMTSVVMVRDGSMVVVSSIGSLVSSEVGIGENAVDLISVCTDDV